MPRTSPFKPRISILVSARRNSKYLAKFLFGLDRTINRIVDIEVLVMLNAHDSWNKDLVYHFEQLPALNVSFYWENMRLGRAGLHEYFNQLAEHATGDWLIYFCEDHFTVMPGWDKYFLNRIDKLNLDPRQVWCIIPKFDNVGAMNQMISRGYYEALGKKVGRHGWIDSYINTLNEIIPDRVIRMDDETFHDFTHDQPSPMADSEVQALDSEKGKALPAFDSEVNRANIDQDRNLLLKAIERGL